MTFQDALTGLSNNTATVVDLTGQPLTKEQIVQLCSALASNISLQSLCLEEVGLDGADADALANVLAHHKTLQRLMLGKNPLGEAGVDAIITLFDNHSTLYRVSASVETKATKTQRNTLKQLNKTHKSRKPEKGATPGAAEGDSHTMLEAMVATYYDRSWGGKQLMADPVFYPKDGKIYERERLIAHEKAMDETTTPLVIAVTLQQHIHQYLATQPHLWHEPETGVYIPRAWQNAVLTAIKAGGGDTLHTYWEKHPGLVTCRYPLGDRQVRLHEVFIVQGQSADFVQWLEHYSVYEKKQYATVPPFATLFSTVEEGHHTLHQLITHKPQQQAWVRPILLELEVTGDMYHGLVQLHSKETAAADEVAITTLLAQQIYPVTKDKLGHTPLMLAISQKKYALADLLLPHSALNVQDTEGNTPLHHAVNQPASQARDNLIVALLSRGLNDTLTNKAGDTAEAVLEAKEPSHYRVLLRALKNKQRGRLQYLEEEVSTLKKALNEQQKQLQLQQEQSQHQQEQLENIFKVQLQTLLTSVDTLSTQMEKLQARNAQLETLSKQRTIQLKNVLADEKVQQKFYAPKKEYLRHLFLATTPEIEVMDKEMKEEVVLKSDLDLQDKLVAACIKGDLPLVMQIHKEGGCLNQPNRAGEYPLVTAIRIMKLHIVDYIDNHSDEVDMPWYVVQERCGDILEEMHRMLDTKYCQHINEHTTYQQLNYRIKMITQIIKNEMVLVNEEAIGHKVNELLYDWDEQWSDSDDALSFDEMCIYCYHESINTRLTHYDDILGEDIQDGYGISSARRILTRYVNNAMDAVSAQSEKIKTYQSRMAKCAERVAQRKNKFVINT